MLPRLRGPVQDDQQRAVGCNVQGSPGSQTADICVLTSSRSLCSGASLSLREMVYVNEPLGKSGHSLNSRIQEASVKGKGASSRTSEQLRRA